MRPDILLIDIETIPRGARELTRASLDGWPPGVEPVEPAPPVYPGAPKNYKSPDVIASHREAWEASAAETQAAAAAKARASAWERYREGALRPSEAEVVCMGWMIDDSEGVAVGEAEVAWLLGDLLLRADRPACVAGWNVGFDASILAAMLHRRGAHTLARELTPVPYALRRQLDYRPIVEIVDVADMWPRGGRYPHPRGELKQETVARVLGVHLDHPIRGNQVLDAVIDGRIDEVIAHCAADVAELAAIVERVWA